MSDTVTEDASIRPALQPREVASLRRASFFLVLVTLLWGMSFPWTKRWQEASTECPGGAVLASLTLILLRMPLAMVILALWQPSLYRRPTWREHGAGALLGATFFAGFLPQTIGLAYTTPALSAFFTGLVSGWAPLLGWVVFRTPVARLTLLGLGVALGGMAVLVEGGWKLGFGEGLTIASSLAFGAQILVLDRFGRRFNPAQLTPGFFAGTALLGLLGGCISAASGPGLTAWAGWTGSMLRRPEVLRDLLLLALLPTVLSFHWMNTYQPRVPASRAALIYLLEPIFSAIFSVYLGLDALKAPLLIGGGLILLGNLLVELPGLLVRRSTEI